MYGFGFLSVHFAQTEAKHVAVKFVKSASHYTDAAKDEIEIMGCLRSAEEGTQYVCSLLDHFALNGPNGRHLALVFPVLGINLWDLLEQYAPDGLSLSTVRYIARQLLAGVAYMHSKHVIHTDLKPENVALRTPSRVIKAIIEGRKDLGTTPEAEQDWLIGVLKSPDICIVDFGNACWTNKHFTDDVQTTQYRAPEVLIRSGYSTPCDMWSVACIFFELLTGDQLFHPKSSKTFSKDDDHVALIVELLGHWPKHFAKGGKRSKSLFNAQGRPKAITRLEMWPLDAVLREKYSLTEEDAEAFASFLLPMLRIVPKERATAAEMMQHPWLVRREVKAATAINEPRKKHRSKDRPAQPAQDDEGDDDDGNDDDDEDKDDNDAKK